MPDAVDIVLRAGRIYSLSGDDAVFGAIAVTGGQIAATSPERAGLEELVGEETLVVDDDSLTVLPAFADSHEHMLDASVNRTRVDPSTAHSIAELLALIRERASATAEGGWVVTAAGWNEGGLEERLGGLRGHRPCVHAGRRPPCLRS